MTAFIIKIGDRFFYKFGKNDRVLTAWHFAGAKQFSCNEPTAELEKLEAKKIAYTILKIALVE
jgi:hypothetical protein